MGQRMARELEEGRPAGFCVTLLVLHCPRCGRMNLCALEGAALRVGRRRVLLKATGLSDWPRLRCRGCEGQDLYLVEDLR
jgi:hypothetical protein